MQREWNFEADRELEQEGLDVMGHGRATVQGRSAPAGVYAGEGLSSELQHQFNPQQNVSSASSTSVFIGKRDKGRVTTGSRSNAGGEIARNDSTSLSSTAAGAGAGTALGGTGQGQGGGSRGLRELRSLVGAPDQPTIDKRDLRERGNHF